MELLDELLERSATYHRHLCPRQVLGVRMALLAGELLGLEMPQPSGRKRLLTIVETDGCATDGISVASNCWVGRRNLRVEDYGKVAATFIDTKTGRAVRVIPRNPVRQQAPSFAPEASNRWQAMLLAYQRMPVETLLQVQEVELTVSVEAIISRPRKRVVCECCGEEILNEREVRSGGTIHCRACAGHSYYRVVAGILTTFPQESAEISPQD
jgi:formylmethanofuran dehydrogenase subunit E